MAFVPVIGRHISKRAASFLLAFPMLILLGFIAQYVTHGQKAIAQLAHAVLIALPALAIFTLITYLLPNSKTNVGVSLVAAGLLWKSRLISLTVW